MARPIILGVVGDSATGKTTITKGLVEILGKDNVTHIGMDDYHKYDRTQRAEHGITPLHPDCNYMDIIEQHLQHLRNGEPILKPVYQHADGTFGPPQYVMPKRFAVIEGLLGYHTQELAVDYDVRVYLAPPEELRREWKIKRDTSKRGYTEPGRARRPRQARAGLRGVHPPAAGPRRHRHLVPRRARTATRTTSTRCSCCARACRTRTSRGSSTRTASDGITLEEKANETCLFIPGNVDRERGAAIEEAIWEKMHFASHLRTERLGEFTVGEEVHRSESLAIVQVLILYHLVTAKAAVAVGGDEAIVALRPGARPRPDAGRSPTTTRTHVPRRRTPPAPRAPRTV